MVEVCGKTIEDWCRDIPELRKVIAYRQTLWLNPKTVSATTALADIELGKNDIIETAQRLERFRPYIAKVFPETAAASGRIESPLQPIPDMQAALSASQNTPLPGKLLLKCDNMLPISGSIKARGGIYEVLKHAEDLAVEHGLLNFTDDYSLLAGNTAQKVFNNYSLAVGSTGNLGLSIGIMGAKLGFQVIVHMSADARRWKKELLKSHGVKVIEYDSDYGQAVRAGRSQAKDDPNCHFIDDEHSPDLFLGYSVAAERLAGQLKEMNVVVNAHHPLFVYLPCGVGGGPGGIAFGLKHLFGDNVRCFFAEPTHSPCMLIGLATALHDSVSVEDFGLDNSTAADGLAVGRASGFICRNMASLIDGVYTVRDKELFRLLALLADNENIYLEPSAMAGIPGISRILASNSATDKFRLADLVDNITHVAWATGGSMVPEAEMASYYNMGKTIRGY